VLSNQGSESVVRRSRVIISLIFVGFTVLLISTCESQCTCYRFVDPSRSKNGKSFCSTAPRPRLILTGPPGALLPFTPQANLRESATEQYPFAASRASFREVPVSWKRKDDGGGDPLALSLLLFPLSNSFLCFGVSFSSYQPSDLRPHSIPFPATSSRVKAYNLQKVRSDSLSDLYVGFQADLSVLSPPPCSASRPNPSLLISALLSSYPCRFPENLLLPAGSLPLEAQLQQDLPPSTSSTSRNFKAPNPTSLASLPLVSSALSEAPLPRTNLFLALVLQNLRIAANLVEFQVERPGEVGGGRKLQARARLRIQTTTNQEDSETSFALSTNPTRLSPFESVARNKPTRTGRTALTHDALDQARVEARRGTTVTVGA